jgi:hypothetical protein
VANGLANKDGLRNFSDKEIAEYRKMCLSRSGMGFGTRMNVGLVVTPNGANAIWRPRKPS